MEVKVKVKEFYNSGKKTIDYAIQLVRSEGDTLVIIKLITHDQMYRAGLERNHKKLVLMSEVANSLAILLESLLSISDSHQLSSAYWINVCVAYRPFIAQKLKFSAIQEFIYGNNADDWE